VSKCDLWAQLACHRKRDSIGARLVIDGLGIARCTLRYGLNADEGALVTEEPDRTATCRPARLD
jgi:hypothetical protein